MPLNNKIIILNQLMLRKDINLEAKVLYKLRNNKIKIKLLIVILNKIKELKINRINNWLSN